MRLFISTEAQVPAVAMIHDILKRINNILGYIEVSDYTDSLDSIGIIINCFSSELINNGFGRERMYISLLRRNADIRLLIPFETFLNSNDEFRYYMVLGNIIKSINVIQEKMDKKKVYFNGKDLISYILAKLDVRWDDLIINSF